MSPPNLLQERKVVGMSRVQKVPQWETKNLGHLHGQEVITDGSRASVRQLDALCSQASPVTGLWFSIIHGSRITGKLRLLVQVEGVLQGVA